METTAPTLAYEYARELIRDGDLISFRPKDKSWLHSLTQFVTKSEFYHSAVAVWMYSAEGTKRLFVCEAQRSGRRLVPLSHYEQFSFDVTCSPIEFSKFESSLLERVGSVAYGFLDYITVGVRTLFGIQIKDANGEICSELVQKAYVAGGYSMPKYILSPGELSEYLKADKIPARVFVRPTKE